MIRPLLIALHEIRIFRQDKGDLAFALLLPIATFALMYGAFGGQTQFQGTAYVVNEDQGTQYSTLLLERLAESENLDVELLSSSEADSKLERSGILLAVNIPAGFSGKLSSGEQAELIFRQRGNGGQEGQIVASLIRSVAEDLSRELQVQAQVESALTGRNIDLGHIELTVQKFLERERGNPTVVVRESTAIEKTDTVTQFLPGIITMYVLFAITATARTMVEERKRGTLERLLTTRLSAGELFTGKFLANISRGFIQSLILLTLAYAVFRIFTPLSFGASLLIALIFSCTASALGLLIASVARTADAASWVSVFFTMFMVMIGGTFFTIGEGSVLATISKISVNTYVNDALNTVIIHGGSISDVGFELGILAGVAIVVLAISRIIFKAMPE